MHCIDPEIWNFFKVKKMKNLKWQVIKLDSQHDVLYCITMHCLSSDNTAILFCIHHSIKTYIRSVNNDLRYNLTSRHPCKNHASCREKAYWELMGLKKIFWQLRIETSFCTIFMLKYYNPAGNLIKDKCKTSPKGLKKGLKIWILKK